jgi:hypothetical protein
MAIALNGTTGISGVDGSASAPAVTGTDSNTGINFGSDTVNINTGGATRATVDSAGRLLIATTSTSGISGNADDLIIGSTSESTARGLTIASTTNANIRFADGGDNATGMIEYNHNNNYMRFYVEAGERMRIDSAGHIFFSGMTSLTASSTNKGVVVENSSANGRINLHATSSAGTAAGILFYHSGNNVGQITYTASATSYGTSSDYRLKENVTAISDGITRLKTLKPSRFNFKVDTDTTVDGFLAHEVTAVPEAITGTKDEVDSDNNPVYQGIDQSKLVPLLTAALQEAIAKIETLETKVAALEAG